MGILSRAINKSAMVEGKGYSLGHSIPTNSVSTLTGSGGNNINVIEEYNAFAWKCIDIRATMLSAEDLFVEKFVGKDWQRDILHDFNDVLEGEDGQRDLSELLEAHEKSLAIYGESFWYFSKGERYGKPVGIYLLNPNDVTVLVADKKIKGYVYNENGNKIILDLDEVSFWRSDDGKNSFRGKGPMQAAGWFIRSARYVNTYVNNFLENNAIPAGVIVAKGSVNNEDWDLFKEGWTQKYSGIDNAGKTGFIRGTDLDFVKTGLSLGEVDFEKLKNTSRDDVMIMFGISKPMMAIFDDINYASALTARQLFALMITRPTLKALSRKLTKKVAKWYGKGYRISSSNPVPEDDEAKLNKFDKLLNRAFTVNEVRAAYGEEPIDGGDVIVPPPTLASEGSKSFLAPKTAGKVVIKLKSTTKGKADKEKEAYRKSCDVIEDKYIDEIIKLATPILKAQHARVVDQIQPKKIIDAYFDIEQETITLTDEVLAGFVGLARAQGALALGYIGKDEQSFKLTPVMETFIKDAVRKAALGFTQDTQAYVAQALTDGINAGESSKDIAKRIGKIYEDVYGTKAPGYRLDRIARTESARISNKVSITAFKESGVVRKKEWYANPGHCGYCSVLNGSIISIDSTFVPKGATLTDNEGNTRINDYSDIQEPPAHVGCRCRPLPVIEEIEF